MTQLFASSPSSAVTNNNEKRGDFRPLPSLPKTLQRIQSPSDENQELFPHQQFKQPLLAWYPLWKQRARTRPGQPWQFRQERKVCLQAIPISPTIGRNRSTTVASEGNPLDDSMSPTATANPYFAHQGQPALRHRNDGSVPSSPPDTPELQVTGVSAVEQATTANKEELARKLRRVASAPNAQGLFQWSEWWSDLKRPRWARSLWWNRPGPGGSVGLASSDKDCCLWLCRQLVAAVMLLSDERTAPIRSKFEMWKLALRASIRSN